MSAADLAWAKPDLEHAMTLYQTAQSCGQSVDETWESQGCVWRLIAKQEFILLGSEVVPGLWEAHLTAAHGDGSTSRFSWSGIEFFEAG
jgi:hypothetical protein